MRRLGVMAIVIIFVALGGASVVNDFITNDPIGYFSREPRQLYLVAAVAAVGGLITWVFHRLSPRAQRRVRMFSWGAAASGMTATVGYFAFCFITLASFMGEYAGLRQILGVLLMLLILSGIAGCLWYEFRRAWMGR